MKDFQILTCFWGSKHLEMFAQATVKSLTKPKNRKALEFATWNVFTDANLYQQTKQLLENGPLILKNLNIMDISALRDRTDYLHSGLVWQIKECLKTKQRMLLAPPDTIFGDGTVPNLLTLGRQATSCVFVPHPRVLPYILKEDFETNAELVRASWKHLHRSWSEAKTGHVRQNSFIGGVSWQKIRKGLYAITHRLPTPYLCDFTQGDLDYFETVVGFGHFDHAWASMLIGQGRQRFVGSSDAAFIVELTEDDKNIPPVVMGGDPDGFWKKEVHNEANKQMVSIFRESHESED